MNENPYTPPSAASTPANRVRRTFQAMLCIVFAVLSGCKDSHDSNALDRVLIVSVSDQGELTMGNKPASFDVLQKELTTGLQQNRWDEIHYFTGKLVSDLDSRTSSLLHSKAKEFEVPLKEFLATGSIP